MASPILLYEPIGGVPIVLPPGEIPPGTGVTTGITQLVEGQAYINVVFDVSQVNADWTFTECFVENTTDPSPLNIWPGIITGRTVDGFTLQLNGMPDSDNYYLYWAVSGVTVPQLPATTYAFSGPASGTVGIPSSNLAVALLPNTTVAAPVTVTPDDGSDGTFTPASVIISATTPSATFTYTAGSAGAKTISVTNDGALTNPASIILTAGTYAIAYTLSGPSSGYKSVASTNFTVTLSGGIGVPAPVTVTPSDGGAGGTFTPTTVTLDSGSPSATFTYTPSTYGARTISATNDAALTDPGSLTYTSLASTYTLSGPSSGDVSVPSTNFTVALPAGGVVIGTVTLTPADGGGGGTFAPTSVGLTTASPSATFTYTPASTGAKTIGVTNSGGLTDPASLTYTATSAVHLLNTLISYWKMDEASGTRNDSNGTNHLLNLSGLTAGATGIISNGANFVAANHDELQCASTSGLQGTGDFTWSLWVKLTSQTLGFVLQKNDATHSDYLLAYNPTTNGYTFTLGTAGPTQQAIEGATTANGVWKHIVAWYDSGTSKLNLRVNDTTTVTAAATIAADPSTGPLFIGSDTLTYFTDGIIDEVGFWKRKLTALEITALYNSGAALAYSLFTA